MKKSGVHRRPTRLLAALLCLLMALSLLPETALAADPDPAPVFGVDWTLEEMRSKWSGYGYTEYWDRDRVYLGKYEPACPKGKHDWALFEGQLDGHSVTSQQQTCSDMGIHHYVCKLCKCGMTSYSKPKGHSHSVYAQSVDHKNPTCTEAGYDKYKCLYFESCREYVTDEIPALGHSWAVYNMVSPSHTAAGRYDYRCQRCKETYSEPIPMLSSYSLPSLMTSRPNSDGQYERGTESQFSNLFSKCESGVRFSQMSAHYDPATNRTKLCNRIEYDKNGFPTLYVGEAVVRDADTRRLVAIVYAEDLTSESTNEYIDVVVYEDDLDVYLVDFGSMKTNKTTSVSRTGLRNLSVTGNYSNVYLVNSHIGLIDADETTSNPYHVYSGGSSGSVNISLSGFNSYVHMGPSSNSGAPETVHAVVSVDTPFYSVENPLYDHNDHRLVMEYLPGNPYNPYRMYNYDRGGWVNSRYVHTPKLELANLTVDSLGSPGGPLSGLGGVKLTNCSWTAGSIELRDFAQLELNDCTLTADEIVLHERSELTLGGDITGDVRTQGTNTLRLNNATLNGSILLEGVSDDYYDAIGQKFGSWDHKTHYLDLNNGGYYTYTGACLNLLLSGESFLQMPAYLSQDAYGTPAIMVDRHAILSVKDDPEREGVGALTVRTMDSYGNLTSPQYSFSSISGTPSTENPLRHGWIFIESGILNLRGYGGSAAIGGSALEPGEKWTDLGEYPEPPAPDDFGGLYTRIESNYYEGETPEESYYYCYGISPTPGFCRDGGTITFNGGVVNAEAEYGAAAIGGARYGSVSGINIYTGATVNARTGGGGAAIGGGLPLYEASYPKVGYQLLRVMNGDNAITGIFVYPAKNKETGEVELRYLNDGWYVDDGGTRYDRVAGELCQEPLTSLTPDTNSAIHKKKLEYVSGGSNGNMVIAGGCAINAWADNPLYEGGYYGDTRVDRERSFYHPLRGDQTEPDSFEPGILYQYSLDYYNSHHDYYPQAELNDQPLFTEHYFFQDPDNGMALSVRSIDELYDFDARGDAEGNTDGFPTYANGRLPGYVLGAACEDTVFKYGNFFEICGSRGLSPTLVLGQYSDGHTEAAWDRYYVEDYGDITIWDQSEEHGPWVPTIVHLYDSVVLNIGYHQEELDNSTWSGYVLRHDLKKYAYELNGQIDISLPEAQYDPAELNLPKGATMKLRSGSILNVGAGITINEDPEDEGQFVVEDGAIVRGKGLWPRKPADPENPPTANQVRSLLARINSAGSGEGASPDAPLVVTHLGVVQIEGGAKMVLSGNSADEIRQKMAAVSLDEQYLLTVFNAGDSGFKKTTVQVDTGEVTTWRLNTYSPDTVISLVENGALVAIPGPYMLANDHLDLILTEKDDDVTVILKSAKLATPEYRVFEGTGDEELELLLEKPGSKTAFRIELTPDQVTNNKCIFSVPKFAGSEFTINTLAPLRNKCAMRFGGTMCFTTPVSDIAGININTLQLDYDGGLALGGIDGGGYVKIPDIGGFPVTGSAKLNLNTFAPNRKLSLDVSLDTPIFSGTFRGGFKEARGLILLDSLYAELSVGKGGIPLVPPTVVGYLQGGGLGISGIADTVAMDGPGAVPLRFEIAAKASIIDVVSGWARVSVGPTGFDVDLENIKVAGYDWIKKFGASASMVTGEKTIKGAKYWGVDTEMSTYLVIGIPLHSIGYGNTINEDEVVAGLSATGSVGIGCFAGYRKAKVDGETWLFFLYQLRASANLSGSLTIPKGIVGGYLPFSTLTVGSLDLGFYAEANAETSVNATEIKETASPIEVVKQLSKNVDLDFKAAIGAKATAGVGKVQVFVRAVYVLGKKTIDLDYGFGSGKKLDLSGAVSKTRAVSTSGYDTSLTATLMEDSDEPVPTIVQTSAATLATLGDAELMDAEDTTDMKLEPDGSVSLTINDALAGNVIIGLKLDQMVNGFGPSQVSVTRNGSAVPLIPDACDENGVSTVSNANFSAGTAAGDDGAEVTSICFVPYEAGTYSISLTVAGAGFVDGQVIETKSFATLDTDETVLGTDSLSYSVSDASESGRYKVQIFLGAEPASGDFLLAETGELSGSDAYEDVLEYSLTGNLAPSGSYYPTILLLEYVDATDAAGNTVGTWAAVDQINLDTTKAYSNPEEVPAPGNVTLAYSGNGSMTASWTGVEGADSYQLTVYRETDNTEWDEAQNAFVPTTGTHFEDSGLLFETTGTSILMDLSSLCGDTAPNLRVGVRAVKNIPAMVQDGENEIEDEESGSQFKTGREKISDAAVLKLPTPPAVSYSDNVRLGEGGSHSIAAGLGGASFDVVAESGLSITVRSNLSADPIASGSGGAPLQVQVPAPTEESLSTPPVLEVLVENPYTGDYTLNTISVSYDTVAPPLILDNLGRYPKWGSEGEFYAQITGHTEAGALVSVYNVTVESDWHWDETGEEQIYEYTYDYEFLTSAAASADGSFAVPVRFSGTPAYCVQAVDAVGNKSVALTVEFPESDVVVNLDPNGGSIQISSIGLADGVAIGALPAPVSSEEAEAFDGWILVAVPIDDTEEINVVELVGTIDAPTETEQVTETEGVELGAEVEPVEIPVTPDMVFTRTETGGTLVSRATGTPIASFSGDPTLHARWTKGVMLSFSPGEGAACSTSKTQYKAGSLVGELPVPRRTDGADMLFLGWFSGSKQYTETSVVSSSDTLTARWATPVTVTFDPGLGDLEMGDEDGEEINALGADGSLRIPMGTAIGQYPDATATGYTFTGWYNGEKAVGASTLYVIDTTLTAHWKRNTAKLIVTQASVGETQALPDPEVVWPTLSGDEEWIGEAIVSYAGTGDTEYLSSAKPTRAGSYEVIVNRNTFETAYVGSAEFSITRENVTFHDVTVASDIEHGSVSASRKEAALGDTVTLTATPEAGYTFQSWTVTQGDTPVAVADDRFTMPDGPVTVSAVFAEKQVVTLSSATAPEGGNILIETDTPARIHAGDSVTLTAPVRNGYRFLGWWAGDGAEPVCDTLVYHFVIEENTELQARYEAAGTALLEIATANGAKYRVGSDPSLQSGSTSRSYDLGTVLTIEADEVGKVLQWENGSGKVMGRGPSLTVTITDAMKVTLVYNTPETNQSIVQFVTENEQVIEARQYLSGAEITFPAPPSMVGYVFNKWVFEGTEEEALAEAIQDRLGTEEIITIRPAYTKDETAYAVTVEYSGEGLSVPGGTFAGITVGTGYTVSAPEIDGYRFECWKLGETVLSYKDSYFFQVIGDVTVTACYVKDTESITAQPVIALTDLFANAVGSVHKVTAVATRSVPEGYTVLEQGMLYGKEYEGMSEDNFRYGTEGVHRYQSADLSRNGVLNMNVTVSSDELVVCFRGYMILRNKSTGNTETIYTTIWKGSYARGKID